MARTFTQKHYIAIADALVEAYQACDLDADTSVFASLGIDKQRAVFVRRFTADSAKFDAVKFHCYIAAALGGARP